jgi:hypothetical protein
MMSIESKNDPHSDLPTMPDPSKNNPGSGPHLPTMPDPVNDPEGGQQFPTEPDPVTKPSRIDDPRRHQELEKKTENDDDVSEQFA